MGLISLDLVFLEVNNLQESVEFYVERLGFELESSLPESEPPLATLHAGRLKITLAEQPLTMARRGRGVHFFIGVTDVDIYHAQLVGRGVEVSPPADEGWGGRFITLQDGDNYRLFFVEWHDKPEGEG
jgi:catechol 2,3-dioxygenase-like lactoylglutathione lyase family enzyme